MDELDVSTVVRVPPERAFEFLVDFPGYANYTEYLRDVRRDGDGGVGTTYELVLSWWLVSYTARSRVTGVEHPRRIDWVLEDALDAEGAWHVEPMDEATVADALGRTALPDGDGGEVGDDGADGAQASRIRLRARFDSGSVGDANLGLPRFVSASGLLDKVAPVAKREAKTVIERIVADLEGAPRDVELAVHSRPDVLK